MHHNGADDTNIFFVLFSKKSVGRLTRFGEILPLWHNVKNFGHFEWVDLLFGKSLSLLWQILNSIGQILHVENGQILNKQLCHLVMLTSTKFSDT